MTSNTNVVAVEVAPIGGNSNAGWRLGFIDSATKAAQNDTWTVTNAREIAMCLVTDDSAGTLDACTISSNVITLTGAATLATTGLIVFKT